MVGGFWGDVWCNPPENTQFCPDDNVTRAQMAAFMRRVSEDPVVDAATAINAANAENANNADHAAEADHAMETDHAATADTAGNADTFDGYNSTALASRAAFPIDNDLPDAPTALNTTIEAPVRGTLVINAAVDAFGAGGNFICELLVDDTYVPGSRMRVRLNSTNDEEDCTTTGALVVDPGPHTVTFNIRGVATGLDAGSVNVVWVPFDGSGAIPATVSGQPPADEDEERTDS